MGTGLSHLHCALRYVFWIAKAITSSAKRRQERFHTPHRGRPVGETLRATERPVPISADGGLSSRAPFDPCPRTVSMLRAGGVGQP